jgi:hypothetical protein
MTQTQTQTKPRIYDAKGASEFVNGVKSARWFKDEARAGRIDAGQIGQTWYFREETLLRLLEESFFPAVNGRKPK